MVSDASTLGVHVGLLPLAPLVHQAIRCRRGASHRRSTYAEPIVSANACAVGSSGVAADTVMATSPVMSAGSVMVIVRLA